MSAHTLTYESVLHVLSRCRANTPGHGHVSARGQRQRDGGVDRERRHQRERGMRAPASCDVPSRSKHTHVVARKVHTDYWSPGAAGFHHMMSLPVFFSLLQLTAGVCLFVSQIDLESVFAMNPDVAPDEEIPQSPEPPLPPSNVAKTSKLPKVSSRPSTSPPCPRRSVLLWTSSHI